MLESRRARVAAGWSITVPWFVDLTADRWKKFLSRVSLTDTRSGFELIEKLASTPKR
jgi:hypothetical protein